MNWKEAAMLVFTVSTCAAALIVVAPRIEATITESKPLDIISTIVNIIAVAVIMLFISFVLNYIRSCDGAKA